jgi:hypothetical protein
MLEFTILLTIVACIAWAVWAVWKHKQACNLVAADEARREALKHPH